MNLKNAKPFDPNAKKEDVQPQQEVKQETATETKAEDQQQETETKENIDNEKDENKLQEQGQVQSESNEEQKQEVQEVSLDDDKVLNYLKEKGIEVNGFEDLTKPKQETEIPEELKSYLDYKKETNRSYNDFLELQKDWKNEDENATLKRYLKDKNPFYDNEDINDVLSEFKVDEDVDDEVDVKRKNRKKKSLLNEAVSYLESQKEKYKTKIEGSSNEVEIPDEYKTAKTKLNEIAKQQEERQSLEAKVREDFVNNTKSVFNEEFKGFEFDVEGQKKVFKSDEPNELFEQQSEFSNFLNKFGENGIIKDHKGFHKALNVALNADKFAEHFYQAGRADEREEDTRDSKNINFSGHKTSDNSKSKSKWKVINPVDNRLRIKK